jgi:hypothetical protein
VSCGCAVASHHLTRHRSMPAEGKTSRAGRQECYQVCDCCHSCILVHLQGVHSHGWQSAWAGSSSCIDCCCLLFCRLGTPSTSVSKSLVCCTPARLRYLANASSCAPSLRAPASKAGWVSSCPWAAAVSLSPLRVSRQQLVLARTGNPVTAADRANKALLTYKCSLPTADMCAVLDS